MYNQNSKQREWIVLFTLLTIPSAPPAPGETFHLQTRQLELEHKSFNNPVRSMGCIFLDFVFYH